jgi:periplasmic divalent cation tolerance protein
MKLILAYITTKDEHQAQEIGSKLVEEHLAACVNIISGMHSIYWWQGSLCNDNETILIAKTRETLFEAIVERVKELHTYSVPCIISIPIKEGNPAYLHWLENETEQKEADSKVR